MHYLQSPAWAAFHTALGNKTFIRSGEGWHYLAILDSESSRITRLYCPYGPQAEDEHSLGVALESLMALARSQGVMYSRLAHQLPNALCAAMAWLRLTTRSLVLPGSLISPLLPMNSLRP